MYLAFVTEIPAPSWSSCKFCIRLNTEIENKKKEAANKEEQDGEKKEAAKEGDDDDDKKQAGTEEDDADEMPDIPKLNLN